MTLNETPNIYIYDFFFLNDLPNYAVKVTTNENTGQKVGGTGEVCLYENAVSKGTLEDVFLIIPKKVCD